MALKLFKKKHAPSNQIKNPIISKLTSGIRPRLDKLTILMDPQSPSDRQAIHDSLYSVLPALSRFSNSSKKEGFGFSGKLSFQESKRSVFIQASPKSEQKPFFRMEMNPSKLGETGLFELHQDLITLMPHGYNYLIEHGRVSRIDVAVDLPMKELGLTMDDLHFLPMQGLTRRDFSVGGKLETIYLGLPKGNQWRIYRKDKEQKKTKGRSLPPTIRVERVIRNPQMKLISLNQMTNPFSGTRLLQKLPPLPTGEKEWQWLMFQDSVRSRGITSALQLLPPVRRQRYRAHLDKFEEGWWDPKGIWLHWSQVLSDLRLIDQHAYP
ncbi:hypothetical protein [Neorhizobium petrolearium]|uniref:hypothetical protein n=1 Tax=Neorhizobium petrolearium TaxID=515361 RepID=UPI003F7FB117